GIRDGHVTGVQTCALPILLEKAAFAERKGQFDEALDFAETAARVWPELPEVLPIYNRLAGRYQRLRVGVVGLPQAQPEAAPVVRSEERRVGKECGCRGGTG